MLSTLPILLLTGCSSEQVEVYLFLIGQEETVSENTSLSHNFTGAYEPADSSDWTSAEDVQTSGSAAFGELISMADGTTLLQVAGQTYVGSGDKGAWTFTWEHYDRGQTADTHSSGYTYTTDYDNSRKDTIGLTEGDDGTLTGTWDSSQTNRFDQAEDDTWSVDVGLNSGQIQVNGQLLVEDQFGTEAPASNSGQDTDCTGSPCLLDVTTTADTTRVVQGILTDYTPEDLEQDIGDYGQGEGY